MNNLILYMTEDGRSQVQLRADQDTVWLTQLEMAELFDATKQNISLHLQNIFEDGELEPSATVKESLTVQIEGSREVRRPVTRYNLDAILAVGYRARSPRGVQFRRRTYHGAGQRGCPTLRPYVLEGRQSAQAGYSDRQELSDRQDDAELKALEAKVKKRKQ